MNEAVSDVTAARAGRNASDMHGIEYGVQQFNSTYTERESNMKRILAAVSFAALAAPVFAAPFEQTELDRVLPSIQNAADNASYGATLDNGVWANDYNFIAPAQ